MAQVLRCGNKSVSIHFSLKLLAIVLNKHKNTNSTSIKQKKSNSHITVFAIGHSLSYPANGVPYPFQS